MQNVNKTWESWEYINGNANVHANTIKRGKETVSTNQWLLVRGQEMGREGEDGGCLQGLQSLW